MLAAEKPLVRKHLPAFIATEVRPGPAAHGMGLKLVLACSRERELHGRAFFKGDSEAPFDRSDEDVSEPS